LELYYINIKHSHIFIREINIQKVVFSLL